MYLKRAISKELTLFKGKNFPYKSKKNCSFFRYTVVLGIGGNLGDTKRIFEKVFVFLKKDRFLKLCQTSSILKNPPFGYLNQPYFYNGVIILRTNLTPKKLLRYVLHVEKLFRRKRSFKDAPRSLDIDIIFFDNKIINTKELTIPHKEWHKRESVIIPLMEVDI